MPCLWLWHGFVTQTALLADTAFMVGWRRLDLSSRVMAHQTILPPFRIMDNLWGLSYSKSCRLDPSLWGVASVACPFQMVFWWLVTITADVCGHLPALGVTRLAGGKLMSPDQRHRVQFRREGRILKAGRCVTDFAIGAEVRLARWLVAVVTFLSQYATAEVAR